MPPATTTGVTRRDRGAAVTPEAPTAPMPPRPRGGRARGTDARPWRRLRAALTERLGYKAAAIFFSVVLWLVVSGEETAEQMIPVRLSTNVDSALVLVGPQPALRALVVGRARDLWKLGDGPLVVRRVFTGDTPDSVRVELRPGDIDLPSGATSAVVRDVQPRAITLRFEPTDAERSRRASAARVAAEAESATARRLRAEAAARVEALRAA
ncbi:MAG: hypothetical protein ACJ79S_22255, partial [Gemmatimonadaceae bacterium]